MGRFNGIGPQVTGGGEIPLFLFLPQESGVPRAAEIWACPHQGSARHALSVQISCAGGGPTSSGRSTLTCRADPPPIPVSVLPLSAALLSPIRSCRSARLTRKLQPQPDPQQRAATQPRANPIATRAVLGVLVIRGHLRGLLGNQLPFVTIPPTWAPKFRIPWVSSAPAPSRREFGHSSVNSRALTA